ncbi:hypothetical protein P8452_32410 [Trifolium repens]|nr:hypothetical protein P8452_32410 [Trifolium repens]
MVRMHVFVNLVFAVFSVTLISQGLAFTNPLDGVRQDQNVLRWLARSSIIYRVTENVFLPSDLRSFGREVSQSLRMLIDLGI